MQQILLIFLFHSISQIKGKSYQLKVIIIKGFIRLNEKALITGVTGQDGSYLAEFLLNKTMKFMV